MKSLTEYLAFNTRTRRDYINITERIEELVRKSGVKEGLCLVNAMHITASVYINDAESGLIKDFDTFGDKPQCLALGNQSRPAEGGKREFGKESVASVSTLSIPHSGNKPRCSPSGYTNVLTIGWRNSLHMNPSRNIGIIELWKIMPTLTLNVRLWEGVRL